MRKFIAIIAFAIVAITGILADEVARREPVFVYGVVQRDSVFEDRVQLPVDDEGMDIIVNVTFDEGANQLLVTLKSSRQMIVFNETTTYKSVFSHNWFAGLTGRKMKPQRLRFPTLVEPDSKYKMSKACYKSFAKTRSHHIFNRWIYGSGRTVAIPGKVQKFVTDSLTQVFQLPDSARSANFTLRNVCLVSQTPRKNKGPKYAIVADADLNRTYKINIERDPCYGKNDLIAAEDTLLKHFTDNFNLFSEQYQTRIVSSNESYEIFEHHRDLILQQYPRRNEASDCTEIQSRRDKYNALFDSLSVMDCALEIDSSLFNMATGVNAAFVLQRAKYIDQNTALWHYSTDAIQKRDLVRQNKHFITEVYDAIVADGILTEEQRKAVELFKRAEEYFYKVCNL